MCAFLLFLVRPFARSTQRVLQVPPLVFLSGYATLTRPTFLSNIWLKQRQKKTPCLSRRGGLGFGAWQCPTFAWGSTLSSALGGFTSEVGMGSGGSRPPWPPGNSSRALFPGFPRGPALPRRGPKGLAARDSHAAPGQGRGAGVNAKQSVKPRSASKAPRGPRRPLGCYMAKPHGQLVSVSCTHYCASTPDLSTWWSSRALQGVLDPREASSWEGLPA